MKAHSKDNKLPTMPPQTLEKLWPRGLVPVQWKLRTTSAVSWAAEAGLDNDIAELDELKPWGLAWRFLTTVL